MGAGGSSTSVETSIVTDIMTKIVARSIQTCSSFSTVIQEIVIDNVSYGVFDGINMDQQFKVTIQCSQDQTQIAKLQNEITNKLSQQSKQTNQAVLSAVNSLVGENNEQDVSTKVKTVIRNDVTAELIQNIISRVNQIQSFSVKNSDHVIVRDVVMKQVGEAILDIAQKNIQDTKLINAMQNQVDQVAVQEMRNPIADTVEAIGKAGAAILGGIGELLSGPLMTILLVLAIIVVIGMIAKKFMGNKTHPQQYVSYAPQQYAQPVTNDTAATNQT